MSRRATKLLLSAACAALMVGTSASVAAAADVRASASSTTTVQSDSEVSQWLLDNGVSQKTVDSLMAKRSAGKKWDSFSSSKAIKSEDSTQDGYLVTKQYYPDGSISIARVQQPTATTTSPTGVHVLKVSGCVGKATGPSSGSWEKCKSDITSGGAVANFLFNYTVPREGYGSFTWAGNGTLSGICDVSGETVQRDIPKESASFSARASHSWHTSCKAFSASGYQAVTLKNGIIREDWNF